MRVTALTLTCSVVIMVYAGEEGSAGELVEDEGQSSSSSPRSLAKVPHTPSLDSGQSKTTSLLGLASCTTKHVNLCGKSHLLNLYKPV